MKSFLLTAAVSALALGANAQTKISVIPEAGVNLTNLRRTVNDQTFETATKAGFRAGANVAFGIGNNLSIQPGIFYAQKGGTNTDSRTVTVSGISTVYNGKYETLIDYVEVPVNAVYYFMDDQSGFFINAGAYFGAAVRGKIKNSGDITVAGTKTPISDDRDLKIGGNEGTATTPGDDIRRWDIGAQAGVGYQMRNGLMLRAQYFIGGTNIVAHDNSKNSMRNGALNIGLGYKFGW